MKLMLAENIRKNRRERGLTQEQLAQALGVTAGAVHKWESGLSVPELETIMELAAHFEISVDALLGYTLQDRRIPLVLEELDRLCCSGDPEAIRLAEQALVKYPNTFDIVYRCAELFLLFGIERHDRALQLRAVSLLEQSLLLIDQNTDPTTGRLTIMGKLASAYISLGELDKGLELLRQHNDGGIFSATIGVCLSMYSDRMQEAQSHLSDALLRSMCQLFDAIAGQVFVYRTSRDYRSAQEILCWGQDILRGLKTGGTPDFLDKLQVNLLVLLAWSQLKLGSGEECRASLTAAAEKAKCFDRSPDYSIASIRFASMLKHANLHDSFAASALDGAAELITLLQEARLEQMWKEITQND